MISFNEANALCRTSKVSPSFLRASASNRGGGASGSSKSRISSIVLLLLLLRFKDASDTCEVFKMALLLDCLFFEWWRWRWKKLWCFFGETGSVMEVWSRAWSLRSRLSISLLFFLLKPLPPPLPPPTSIPADGAVMKIGWKEMSERNAHPVLLSDRGGSLRDEAKAKDGVSNRSTPHNRCKSFSGMSWMHTVKYKVYSTNIRTRRLSAVCRTRDNSTTMQWRSRVESFWYWYRLSSQSCDNLTDDVLLLLLFEWMSGNTVRIRDTNKLEQKGKSFYGVDSGSSVVEWATPFSKKQARKRCGNSNPQHLTKICTRGLKENDKQSQRTSGRQQSSHKI